MDDSVPAVELRSIGKSFGTTVANRDVDLVVARGSIHGLVGENGAGKTTLMNILYGSLQPDRGAIRLDGAAVRLRNPADAIAHGIGMVHQHFMLVDRFTVLDNLLLGAEGGGWLGGARRARSELARLAADYGLVIGPAAVIEDLPVGLQQRVEIIKALFRGAEILILDEPTAVLTPQEADHLFRILRGLAGEGKTIILVTHKLREVISVTDRVTVMRQGAVVAERVTRETDEAELAALMVGRQVTLRQTRTARRPGAPVLAVDGLRVIDATDQALLKDIALTVRAGEIVGIAGVAGNGQSELLAALAGLIVPASGRIRLNGEDITTLDARARRRRGIGHIPEDRLRAGLVPDLVAAECTILGDQREKRCSGKLLLHHDAIRAETLSRMRDYDVRPADPDLRASLFSGGNQQKLVCAREMAQRPVLLLVGQPTRGVDIGAIEFIHRRLLALRDSGSAILLVSVELDEIRALSDRILVMADGAIVGELPPHSDERTLGLLMAGIGAAA
ncbi:MAG TPA: ABC transporter ATP-binding protein [Stellaceae bacterium]|jgi:simple sugar transport system ATP-binding protein|nr:ABC transporter ATP-binding protein [Stellaceae bacterium]